MNVSATAMSGEPVTYSLVSCKMHAQNHGVCGQSSILLYSGTPTPEGLYFTVGSSSGLVEATGTLDREIFSRYTIIVKVITSCLSWLYIHYYSMWQRAEILNS